jgi:hypothetical protein
VQNSGDVQARFFNEPGLFFGAHSIQPSAFSHFSEVSSEARDFYRHEKSPSAQVSSLDFVLSSRSHCHAARHTPASSARKMKDTANKQNPTERGGSKPGG